MKSEKCNIRLNRSQQSCLAKLTRYWQSSDPAVVDNKIISQILKLTIHDCSVVNSGPRGGPAR